MEKIYKTLDYSIFKYYDLNRKVSTRHKNDLKKSLTKINLLKYKPVIVDNNYYVVDGQHRIAAAKELGIEVYYVVLPKEISGCDAMVLFNQKQVEWKVTDFLKYHAGVKGDGYEGLLKFISENNLPLCYVREFYSDKMLTSKDIRDGSICIEQSEISQRCADFLKSPECKMAKLTSSCFIRAIAKAHKIYTEKQLEKIKKNLIYLEPKANTNQYLVAFEKIVKRHR